MDYAQMSECVLNIGILFDFENKHDPDKFILLARQEGSFSEEQASRNLAKWLRVDLNSPTCTKSPCFSFDLSRISGLETCFSHLNLFIYVRTSVYTDLMHPCFYLIDDLSGESIYIIAENSGQELKRSAGNVFCTFSYSEGSKFTIRIYRGVISRELWLLWSNLVSHRNPKVNGRFPNPVSLVVFSESDVSGERWGIVKDSRTVLNSRSSDCYLDQDDLSRIVIDYFNARISRGQSSREGNP